MPRFSANSVLMLKLKTIRFLTFSLTGSLRLPLTDVKQSRSFRNLPPIHEHILVDFVDARLVRS